MKKMSVWTSWPVWAKSVKRKCPYGQVGHAKMIVWTNWLVYTATEIIKRLRG